MSWLLFIFYFLVSAIVGLITALIVYARWKYGSLEKLGIPVVKPSFLFGSYPDSHKIILHEEDIKNGKKYGPIWGVYEGREPHVYIADPELVRQICIKDFDSFHDRRHLDFGHIFFNEMMDVLPVDKWKVVRNAFSPTLTTGKIRIMSHQMVQSITELFDHIKESTVQSQTFDFKRLYACLTIDVIARCAFGIKVSSLNDPDNIFVKMVHKLTGDDEETDPDYMLAVVQTFRFLTKMSPFISPDVADYFGKVLGEILKTRKASGTKQNDLLDLFNEVLDNTDSEKYKRLGITHNTVMAQALIFLFAGFETTATTLSMFSYRLATNPDKQDKLLEEVDKYLAKNNGKIEHETLGELVYLSACMNETLRMCPPLMRLERVCQKDWSYEPKGLHLKKGQVVQMPSWAMHYDPSIYSNPDQFQPERFLPENKDKLNGYAFLAFGQGPHNCIGMRFAQEEIKLTMATILKDYFFETTEKTQVKFKPGRLFLAQFYPLELKINKRSK